MLHPGAVWAPGIIVPEDIIVVSWEEQGTGTVGHGGIGAWTVCWGRGGRAENGGARQCGWESSSGGAGQQGATSYSGSDESSARVGVFGLLRRRGAGALETPHRAEAQPTKPSRY